MTTDAMHLPADTIASAHGADAITVSGLSKRYGDHLVVDDLTFAVPAGAVAGLVGPNGAGKTTTIRMLLGLIRPTAGSGQMLGHPLADPGAFLPRVGALIDGPAFTPSLSGRDNLLMLSRLGGIPGGRIDEVLKVVDLTEPGDDPVRTYSLGMRQRLGIAAALLPAPELLVLDEPTNGLDPAGILEMRSLLRELAAQGVSVVVSSHLLAEVEAVCSYLVVLLAGRLAFAGDLEAFTSSRRSTLRLTPEDPGDLPALVDLCTRLDIIARVEGDDLMADVPTSRAAELNRRAMEAGVTLRGLHAEVPTLEEAFFRMQEEAR